MIVHSPRVDLDIKHIIIRRESILAFIKHFSNWFILHRWSLLLRTFSTSCSAQIIPWCYEKKYGLVSLAYYKVNQKKNRLLVDLSFQIIQNENGIETKDSELGEEGKKTSQM